MSNKLGGKQGTAYLGTNADQPPNWVFAVKDPTQYDVNNVSLGDLWLNQINKDVWVLVSLAGIPGSHGSLATWSKLEAGGLGALQTLTGNTGGAVAADGSANINVIGDGIGITITGNPGTNTLTASLVGGGAFANSFPTDSGTATPAGGILNIKAGTTTQNSGSSVFFTGAGNTVELNVSDAAGNTIIGLDAGNAILSGNHNAILGTNSGTSLTSGSANTFVGFQAGNLIGSGSDNIIVGNTAGSAYTNTESSNIAIGATGTVAESHALHIGAGTGTGTGQLNKSFISGIRGITPATTDGIPVFIGSAGQLGTVGTGGATLVSTLTGNTGGAVGPSAGNINIVGDGTTIQITGNPGTNTLTVVGLGGGGGTLSQLSGDTGFALPAAGIINVITGQSTLHSGSSVSFSGSGDTLTLNITDANTNTIIGKNSGNASITGTQNLVVGFHSGISLASGSTNILLGFNAGNTLAAGNDNVIMGEQAGALLFSGSSNIMIGPNAGSSSVTDSENIFIGIDAGNAVSGGNGNIIVGAHSGPLVTAVSFNTFCGANIAGALTTGANNTFLGANTATSYTSNESSNILIGASTTGTLGESHALHVGAGTGTSVGQLNKSFIAGIRGITPATADGIPVFIGSAGQLGTVGTGGTALVSKLTGNTGGAVSPTAGNINVIGDGTSVNVVGNPGTSTLTISAVGGAGGPSFFAYLNTTSASQTGGVLNQVSYDTLPTNTGSAFNLGTSTFTAPVTGLYNFSCGSAIFNTSATKSGYVQLITSSYTIFLFQGNLTGIITNFVGQTLSTAIGNNAYVQMTAGDTAAIWISQSFAYTLSGSSGGSPAGIPNYFSGSLV